MLAIELDLEVVRGRGETRHRTGLNGIEAKRFQVNPDDVAGLRDDRQSLPSRLIKVGGGAGPGFEIREHGSIVVRTRTRLRDAQKGRHIVVIDDDWPAVRPGLIVGERTKR